MNIYDDMPILAGIISNYKNGVLLLMDRCFDAMMDICYIDYIETIPNSMNIYDDLPASGILPFW